MSLHLAVFGLFFAPLVVAAKSFEVTFVVTKSADVMHQASPP